MTLRRDQVQVGQEIETALGSGQNTRWVRGTVINIVETAQECYAVVETAERDALGLRRGRTDLQRSLQRYRCKLDTGSQLPECPLASRTCHSPCDILARSYGRSYRYPDVVRLPE